VFRAHFGQGRARWIIGERVHPGTGVHLIYVACDVIAGTARAP
jgi:hypothetical protein